MNWDEAIPILQQGGVIIFPTETVWGIAAAVDNEGAVRTFYEIKRRDPNKPSQVLIGSMAMAESYGIFLDKAKELAEKHWPGALTLVVPATENVSSAVKNDDETVGLRWPDLEPLSNMIIELGSGLVASSANFSGGEPPKSREEIKPELTKKVAGIVDYEIKTQGQSSTVARISEQGIEILRQGTIFLT
jgi:tRNA threonylcarbamoyl adenosine modification protein (Sua5/YciO/YrdC/YwlC family)